MAAFRIMNIFEKSGIASLFKHFWMTEKAFLPKLVQKLETFLSHKVSSQVTVKLLNQNQYSKRVKKLSVTQGGF